MRAPDWRSPQDERELARKERQYKKANRAWTLKFARQKDSKLVARLKAQWAKQDEQARQQIQRRTFEYTCQLCQRPFTNPRKFTVSQIKRCPPCRAFWRRKLLRENYEKNREKRLQYQREYSAKHRQPKEEQKLPNLPAWYYPDYGR